MYSSPVMTTIVALIGHVRIINSQSILKEYLTILSILALIISFSSWIMDFAFPNSHVAHAHTKESAIELCKQTYYPKWLI